MTVYEMISCFHMMQGARRMNVSSNLTLCLFFSTRACTSESIEYKVCNRQVKYDSGDQKK